MSNTIIQVENLGKKYLIKHQQQGSSPFFKKLMRQG